MTFYRLLFWLAFQLALERQFFALGTEKPPKLAPTWVPKTGPKSTQNLTNRLQISTSLQDAPKMAPNLEKHPKICKNLQKCYQHGRIMGPKFYQNPCQAESTSSLSVSTLESDASDSRFQSSSGA